MADQHVGFPGSVNSAQLADWMPNVGAGQYHVEGLEDGRVVSNGVGDRGVTVKKGRIIGDAIMDTFENDVTLNFAAVPPGSPDRWDMVVLRRTWNATPGASTAVYTIIQGGSNRSLPARNMSKGVISDQPMALVRLRAGQNVVQDIVDLRCWAHNGGFICLSELVMQYQDQLGTDLTIGQERWIYTIAENGANLSAYWHRVTAGGTMQLFNWGGVLKGDRPNPGVPPQFRVQAGSLVQSTDDQGFSTLTFPEPFPNGLVTVLLTNGDSSIDRAVGRGTITMSVSGAPWGTGEKHGVAYTVNVATALLGRQAHRLNWIAIGW